MVATTTGFLGCPSPTPTTPSLVFSTPRMDSPYAPAPVNALSDDAGATTHSPMALDTPTFDHTQSPATPSSVDHAASLGLLGSHAPAHMHLSPLAQECAPRSSLTPDCPASVDYWQTPNQTMTTIEELEHAKSYGDSTSAAAAMALSAPVREGEQDQKWFTDVDWYGAESPLACFDQPQSSGYASWGTTC
ncbi:hypothetical protein C8Q74DRAFT_1233669 [Fomes fomentarius]|nr:hypothetical protein C8Q74DRAFT_1233669 [Fomes fomentarius]